MRHTVYLNGDMILDHHTDLSHKVREIHPDVNIIALTATATKKVTKDIIENLNLKKSAIFKKSFFRENLAYQVIQNENKIGKLEKIFKKKPLPYNYLCWV